MLKRICSLAAVLMIVFVFSVPAFANANLPKGNGICIIDDQADLVSNEDKNRLMQYGNQIADETGFIVFIKTVDFRQDTREVRVYLADEYEAMGYTDAMPAIMMGIDMERREVAIVTSEVSQAVYPVKVTNRMVDDVTDYLSDGEYAAAMEQFLHDARHYAMNYGIKPVGKIIGISFGVGILTALTVVITMICMHPKISNAKISASKYIKGNRAEIYNRRDRFISTHTTQRKIETNSGGGSASGGSFHSSSGGHYSGSSGKF